MKTWIIVRKEDLAILGHYMAEQKDETSNDRSHLMAQPAAVHLELPEGMSPTLVKCEMEDEEIVLSAVAVDAWAEVRAKRDSLLAATDKYLIADYPISASNKTAIKAYRTALRDIPEDNEDPSEVVWPEFPL